MQRSSSPYQSISPVTAKSVDDLTIDKEEKDKEEDGMTGNAAESNVVEPPPEAPEGEMRQPRLGRRPVLPTKAEVEEHFPLHLNYRSWCKHFVAGKAILAQHKAAEPDRERLGVTWNADYAFMGAEEAEEGM